jgi:uncharacterized protein (TIGR03546 family)
MLRMLVLPFRALVAALAAYDSPRGFAWGTALGMAWGLLPKDNLFSAALAVAVLATHANAAAAAVSAFVFSWVGGWCDPLAHRLGHALLTAQFLEGTWTWIYNLPLARWTRFNNTVVLGNALLASCLAFPTYRLAVACYTRHRAKAAELLSRWKAALWLKLAGAATARRWR